MLRDVFYFGKKPNAHPRERFAKDYEEASRLASTEHFWIINELCDYRNFDWDFDFDLLPDEDVWAEDHINVFPSQWQKDSGTWLCSTELVDVRYTIYRNDVGVVKRKNEKTPEYVVNHVIDDGCFDFSWHPDPTDPPYIYVWGNQHWGAEIMPTIEYHVSGATNFKYMHNQVAKLAPRYDLYEELIKCKDFDYSWCPNPLEPKYIYVWGNQWHSPEKEPTVIYKVEGATEVKFMHDRIATVLPTSENWETLIGVNDFDYSWRPDPGDPEYIYVWGNQWHSPEKEPTIRYRVGNATEVKFMHDRIATALPTSENWENLLEVKDFDYSWRPDPGNPAYVYVFGNKWNSSEVEPTVIYRVEGATEYKFINSPVAITEPVLDNWKVSDNPLYANFDYSWRPHPMTAPVTYEWPNGPVYNTPGAKGVVKMEFNEHYLSSVIEKKQVVEQQVDEKPIHQKYQTMFWVDRGNSESLSRFDALKQKYPMLQKTRYLNTWVDTINRCAKKADTQLFWVLNSELDYTDFEFDYSPNPWQMKMVHVFGTQWSHWGNTYLINRDTFQEDTKYVNLIEHLNVLNFIKDKKARATNCLYNVQLIDFGNSQSETVERIIQSKIGDKKVDVIEFDTSYLQTFKNLLNNLSDSPKEHYLWVCSSVCDYSSFDFTYICDPFARDQLHVFPSERQKYGDTFLVNVNKLRELINDMEVLEQYDKVSFNEHQRVKRLPAPNVIVEEDTHTSIVKMYEFDFPYAVFATVDNKQLLSYTDTDPISLWQPDHRVVLSTSTGSSRIIIPKDAKSIIKRELYDYPYIKTSNKLLDSNALNVIFLSNGEKCAENNFEFLQEVLAGKPNKLKRIDGVNGRVDAYHACANVSDTPWFLTVFAKLRVNHAFDWSWQPDRLQVPKHYIFSATNPLNGLCYGHQAMIAYNKQLVLANRGRGLDFTLDDKHESVELDSGIAMFNTDEFSTWRTAFRESIKLKVDAEYNNDAIAKERLDTWLTVAQGEYGKWCVSGAKDGVAYFNEVDGDIFELRESYEWAWCRDRFDKLYK